MWKRKRPLALLLGVTLLLTLAAPVSGEPLPHAFFGTLTIGGAPAPVGSTVTAVVTGGGGTIVTTTAGQYGGPGALDARLVVAGDIDVDALIEFFVDGAPADQTANYRAGRATELNLSVPGPASYGLSLSSSEGGAVTDPGEGPFLYEEGTVVPLEATADGCYEFAGWSGDTDTVDDINAASTTVTMDGEYTITANFTVIQYELTTASGAGGSITDPGEPGPFPFDCGSEIPLLATPAGESEFTGWTGDIATVADTGAAATTITMEGDHSITANFTPIQRQLTTASSAGGSVTNPGEGQNTYDHGTVVDLLAVPNVGFEFVNWTGDTATIDDANAADTTITMGGDYAITANFAAIQHQLSVASTAGGSVTVPGEPGPFPYDEGSIVDLLAVPDNGFEFLNWSGDAVGDTGAAATTITMDADHSVTANFVEAGTTFELTVDSTAGGSVTDPGEPGPFTYDAGETAPLLAVADNGFAFAGWTGDVATIADANAAETTIVMDSDYAVTANFETRAIWTVELCPGWNTFSVPITPDESMDTWGELGANLALDPNSAAYFFDALDQAWGLVQADYQLMPGDAIYLKMAASDALGILPTETPTISARHLYAGWNLVGLAYLPWQADPPIPGMKVNEALVSVAEVTGALPGYVTVVSPPLCQEPWIYSGGLIADWNGQPPEPDGWMVIGSGYWVYMLNDGVLAGFTSTPVNW